ncbi:hypothetical protein CHARACLAT_029822, partial [Characodon lateralis]|nr:hypothetical protein [Characodon lateralis]
VAGELVPISSGLRVGRSYKSVFRHLLGIAGLRENSSSRKLDAGASFPLLRQGGEEQTAAVF